MKIKSTYKVGNNSKYVVGKVEKVYSSIEVHILKKDQEKEENLKESSNNDNFDDILKQKIIQYKRDK